MINYHSDDSNSITTEKTWIKNISRKKSYLVLGTRLTDSRIRWNCHQYRYRSQIQMRTQLYWRKVPESKIIHNRYRYKYSTTQAGNPIRVRFKIGRYRTYGIYFEFSLKVLSNTHSRLLILWAYQKMLLFLTGFNRTPERILKPKNSSLSTAKRNKKITLFLTTVTICLLASLSSKHLADFLDFCPESLAVSFVKLRNEGQWDKPPNELMLRRGAECVSVDDIEE